MLGLTSKHCHTLCIITENYVDLCNIANCICVGCWESVEKSIKVIMAFSASGWLLRGQNHGTRRLNTLALTKPLTGVDCWLLLQATAATWYATQMVK